MLSSFIGASLARCFRLTHTHAQRERERETNTETERDREERQRNRHTDPARRAKRAKLAHRGRGCRESGGGTWGGSRGWRAWPPRGR
eukprot:2510170-Rhodomonas_salina.1